MPEAIIIESGMNIQTALERATPGVDVLVRGGTYNQTIKPNMRGKGRPDAWVTWKPYVGSDGTPEPVTIIGEIAPRNCDYFRMQGFTVRGRETSPADKLIQIWGGQAVELLDLRIPWTKGTAAICVQESMDTNEAPGWYRIARVIIDEVARGANRTTGQCHGYYLSARSKERSIIEQCIVGPKVLAGSSVKVGVGSANSSTPTGNVTFDRCLFMQRMKFSQNARDIDVTNSIISAPSSTSSYAVDLQTASGYTFRGENVGFENNLIWNVNKGNVARTGVAGVRYGTFVVRDPQVQADYRFDPDLAQAYGPAWLMGSAPEPQADPRDLRIAELEAQLRARDLTNTELAAQLGALVEWQARVRAIVQS